MNVEVKNREGGIILVNWDNVQYASETVSPYSKEKTTEIHFSFKEIISTTETVKQIKNKLK